MEEAGPDDPYFTSRGSWNQDFDDQWAIKRVGFTADDDSAWNQVGDNPSPVIVAVIDTGIDWNHRDVDWDRIWKNEGEVASNGIDDDGNGYVDDLIGWDFTHGTNRPWDTGGHGTFVAGIIGTASGNGLGIAGINPYARIMPLKVMNSFGQTRSSYLVEAIVYAVDNGAQVINISIGGEGLTHAEKLAVDYAYAKGVVALFQLGQRTFVQWHNAPSARSRL